MKRITRGLKQRSTILARAVPAWADPRVHQAYVPPITRDTAHDQRSLNRSVLNRAAIQPVARPTMKPTPATVATVFSGWRFT